MKFILSDFKFIFALYNSLTYYLDLQVVRGQANWTPIVEKLRNLVN